MLRQGVQSRVICTELNISRTTLFYWRKKLREKGDMEVGFLSRLLTKLTVLIGACGIAYAMVIFHPDDKFTTIVFYLMAIILVISALVSCIALAKSGLVLGTFLMVFAAIITDLSLYLL